METVLLCKFDLIYTLIISRFYLSLHTFQLPKCLSYCHRQCFRKKSMGREKKL